MLALRRIQQRVSIDGRMVVTLCGGFEQRYATLVTEAGLENVIRVAGMIPYLDSLSMQRASDCLMLLDAKLTTTSELA